MSRLIYISILLGVYLLLPETNVEAQEYTAGNLRDPFSSYLPTEMPEEERKETTEAPVEEEARLPELLVQGIVWGTNSPLAIINNKVVKVGDFIQEAKVLNIGREGVELSYKEREFFVKPPSPKLEWKLRIGE